MIYVVTEKASGNEVYRYEAEAPIEWINMEFATHDHVAEVAVNPDGSIEGSAVVVQTKLTKLEYMNRFTDAELAAIYTAAKAVVQVEIWLKKFELATEVDLSDERTIAGLNALEAAGLIGAGRAQEILNGN
jgi:hypothetical protein